MNYLFIDLETFGHEPEKPEVQMPTADDVRVGNLKDPRKIQEKIDKELPRLQAEARQKVDSEFDKEWRKNALKSLHCSVICAAVAWNDEPVQSVAGGDYAVMETLDALLENIDPQNIAVIGHNLAFFDAPIIYHRAIKYGFKNLFHVFNFKRYDPRMMDTQQMFAGTDYKTHYSMNDVAEFLGLGSKTEGMDGSKVHDEYLAGNMDKIVEYCREDVKLLRKIFWMLNQFND